MTRFISWLKIERSDLTRPSVAVLILANLVPLYGVLFLGWQVFPLMMLFWAENVIVGIFNVFKLLTCEKGGLIARAGAVIFFCIHYGIFTGVHGMFVFFMFGGLADDTPGVSWPEAFTGAVLDLRVFWGVLALFLSHGVSFAMNYIGNGEYKNSTLNQLMAAPYTRVVILHITIIAGAFLMMVLGSPIGGLIILVAIKILVDILAHLRQHKKTSPAISKAPAIMEE